jgi:hypothetical protein
MNYCPTAGLGGVRAFDTIFDSKWTNDFSYGAVDDALARWPNTTRGAATRLITLQPDAIAFRDSLGKKGLIWMGLMIAFWPCIIVCLLAVLDGLHGSNTRPWAMHLFMPLWLDRRDIDDDVFQSSCFCPVILGCVEPWNSSVHRHADGTIARKYGMNSTHPGSECGLKTLFYCKRRVGLANACENCKQCSQKVGLFLRSTSFY